MWKDAPELKEQEIINKGMACGVESLWARDGPLTEHELERRGPFFSHGYYISLSRYNSGPYKDMDDATISNILYRIILEHAVEPEFSPLELI